MNQITKIIFWTASSVFGIMAFNAKGAYAWGHDGHEIINRSAVRLMTSPDRGFFAANEDNLALFANTPDVRWKAPATYNSEKPMHFFQWDRYRDSKLAAQMPIDLTGATNLLGATYITANGSAPWRAAQIYGMLQESLGRGDCGRALQLAGVLGHYIGDLSQPMHNTSDYDGQSINQPGVHKLFESTMVGQQNKADLLAKVVSNGSQGHDELAAIPLRGAQIDVIALTGKESELSLTDLRRILDDFQQSQQGQTDLVAQFPPLMGRGAFTLAKIWDSASEAAAAQQGKGNCPATKIPLAEPGWFPLN